MAFEMICGQCRGNLLVEHFGVVVACPHCGAHLHVPDPDAPTEPSPVSIATESAPLPVPVAVEEPVAPAPVSSDTEPEPAPPTEEISVFTGEESEPPPSVEISVMPSIAVSEEAPTESVTEEAPVSAAGDGGFSLSKLLAASATEEATTEPTPEPARQAPDLSSQVAVSEATAPIAATLPTESVVPQVTPEPVIVSAPVVSEPVAAQINDAVPSGLSDIFGSSASAPPSHETAAVTEQTANAAAASAIPESDPPFSERSEASSFAEAPHAVVPAAAASKPEENHDLVTFSKAMFVVLISYASAMTLGFGWLLYQMKSGGAGGGLESLPDPVPAKKTGFQWYPPKTVMTAGHDLGIGDSQRYGNIKVTVLKVTRGPIQFRHFSDAQQTRPPTFPVLKLWLRFENVSDDQEIAPLDDQLLFRRSGTNYTQYKSSQFVCRADQKTKPNPKIVIAYDHVSGSGWDLANLPLDKPLAPHESREYYVPTVEQNLDELTGNLVWRVHIRKGYSARGNGVTTLFEVHFDSNDIHDEPA